MKFIDKIVENHYGKFMIFAGICYTCVVLLIHYYAE